MRIPLKLDTAPVPDGEVFILTQGVPFADAQLPNGSPVRAVDSSGNAFPTQAATLATWGPDRKYVKWLLLDVQLPGALSTNGAELFLEHGPGVDWIEPEHPVRVLEDPLDEPDAGIRITGDKLELALKRGDPDFFKALRVRGPHGWVGLARTHPGPYTYMTDGHGNCYDSFTSAPAPCIAVEDRGPVRVSVCIRGIHADERGRTFCPYVIRIHAYSGTSDLKIFHTFVLDQNPDHTELAAVGMMFPLDLSGEFRMTFGGGTGPHRLDRCGEGCFLQTSDRAYKITRDGEPFAAGRRTRGWAHLAGERGAAAVALRDAWREFPKGVRLTPEGIDVQLWPIDCREKMNFDVPWKEAPIRAKRPDELLEQLKRRPTAGVNMKGFFGNQDIDPNQAEGNFESMRDAKAFAEKHLRDRIVSYSDTSHDGRAWGLAKTHEFRLRLSAEPIGDERTEAWAGGVQRPPIAFPDPAYACATSALGIVHPQDKAAFPEVAEGLKRMFDKLWAGPVEECRLYGDLDFGDLVNCHVRCGGYVYRLFRDEPGFKITRLVGWHNNEAYDLAYSLIQYAVRTGKRKHWALAEAFAEHLRDVDTVHYHPTRPECVGLTHYHNMMHWSAPPSPSHTLVAGWLAHYYLTGDRRSLDAVRETAEGILAGQEPCSIVANREGVLRREFASPMTNLWEVYKATWEEKYADVARRTLKWFLKTRHECGQFPRDVFTSGPRGDRGRVSDVVGAGGGGREGYTFAEAYRLTGDPEIKAAIIGCADWIVESVEKNYHLGARLPGDAAPAKPGASPLWHMSIPSVMLAHAYRFTGDERYVKPLRDLVAEFPDRANEWANMLVWTPWQNAGLAMQVIAAALAVLAESDPRAAPTPASTR